MSTNNSKTIYQNSKIFNYSDIDEDGNINSCVIVGFQNVLKNYIYKKSNKLYAKMLIKNTNLLNINTIFKFYLSDKVYYKVIQKDYTQTGKCLILFAELLQENDYDY